MQVIWFKEVTNRAREDDIDTNQRQNRTFQAITDAADGGPDQVIAYAEVPALGASLQYIDESSGAPVVVTDSTLVVVRRRAEQLDADNLCNWTVTIEYMGIGEPEVEPHDIEYSPTRYQEAMVDDVNGVPIVNTAGDPLIEGVMRDRTRFTITIVKNVLDGDWDPILADTYQDSTNLVAFLAARHPPGFPGDTCKLTLGAKRIRKKGLDTFYWRVTAVIDVDLAGWNAKVRSAGFRYYDAAEAKPIPIIEEAHGHQVVAPVLLAADGSRLPPTGTPVICNPPLGFKRYFTMDWSVFPWLEY
jgi:hypothetical protein